MASVQLRKRGKSDSKPVKKLVKVEYEEDIKVTIPDKVANVPAWEPKNWRDQFDNIRKMREKADAPVDNVGASKLADTTVLPEVIVHLLLLWTYFNMCYYLFADYNAGLGVCILKCTLICSAARD